MRKEKNLQNLTLVFLAIAVLIMSVGFAAYNQTLNITGTTTFSAAKWDVHFDTSTFNETSTIKATTKNVGDTAITYSVTLPSPGSTYSFTVNAINAGTINAQLKKITLSGLTTAQQEYITYTVNYAGTDYTATTDGLAINLPAGSSNTAQVTVTVNYVYPEAASSLPATDQELTLTAAFDYQSVN